jgi:hypothetical protein
MSKYKKVVSYKDQRKTLVNALRYLRKHKILRPIRGMQWDLVNLRKQRARQDHWKRIYQ